MSGHPPIAGDEAAGKANAPGMHVTTFGKIILVKVRGMPTRDFIRELQVRVLVLARDSARTRVLYDALELEPPSVEIPLAQRALDRDSGAAHLRRAVLVSNSKLAYLGRLAFGDGDYRIFYNDVVGALTWLASDEPGEE